MSAPKRLRARRYDTQPKLMRMLDLEPEDASWVCYPNAAWLAIESKAEAALMHQNIEFQWEHVDGYELADFLNETFDSDWRRAPVRQHAIRVNQLQRLRDQIDRGHWVVLGWTECNMVEWVEDAGVLGGGHWQLRWQWKSVENGSALVRHLNEVTQRRWRASALNRTPLSGEPFRAQFDAPKPGVLVADRSGSIWPTMGGSRARTDEDELTGASGRSGDWTSQAKTDLMSQGVAHGLDAIAGGGGMLPPGANPGMVLVQSAAMLLAKALPGYVPSNAILNNGGDESVQQSASKSSGDAARLTGQEREQRVANIVNGSTSGEKVAIIGMGSTDIDVVAPNGDLIAVGGPAKANNLGKLGQELRIYQAIADQRGVSAQVYFVEGTPQSAINLATKILGEGNVKIFSGSK